MKKPMTQLATLLALAHFFVIACFSLFAQEGMPTAKGGLKNSENYAAPTAALSLIQTFPKLPPSGRKGSFLGEEVTNLGDVNGDGYDDWALELKDAAIYPSGKKTGKVHIYLGSNTLVNEKDPDLILTGEADTDLFGYSVAAAGDVNQDGFADVIIGADGNSAAGYQMGRAYVYAGSTATVGIAGRENETSGRYHLFENYPNPFNPTTNIRFSLPQREHVTLKIFDLLGKEVATLVEDELAQGEHAVIFDGNGLSSGVYLYHLQAGSFVEQKKLGLLR